MTGRHAKPAGPVRWPVIAGVVAVLLVAVVAVVASAISPTSSPPGGELAEPKPKSRLSDISSAVDSATTMPAPAPVPTYTPPKTTLAPRSVVPKPAPAPKPLAVVALQPSHQDDTGEGWHEYVICGDIADQTFRTAPSIEWVKAWDINHGLTGSNNYRPRPSNTPAFDKEVAIANGAHARYFIAIHNDGGAPSGVLGEYMPGDGRGARLTEYLVSTLSTKLGLPNRGVRDIRLYSLEPERNRARYRSLLEIGDNVADRAFLSSAANRKKIGRVLGAALVRFIRANDNR